MEESYCLSVMKETFNYVHKCWKFGKYISNELKTTNF